MPSREKNILVVLLIVLASMIAYRLATREEPKKLKELTFKPGSKERTGLKPASGLGDIGSGSLETERGRYRGVIRNPFQALYPAPPAPVVPKAVIIPAPTPFPVITARGPSPAQIESGRFKFLGFLQKEGDKKVFLSRDKEVFIVKKGDSVSMFQVADIAENTVTLISRDSNEEFKLIIEDVKPTKPGTAPGGGRR